MAQTKTLYVTNRKEWRKWLRKNHLTIKEIWLIYYKKHTGKETIPYENAVEEALCFGWIDSIVKRIDDERYMQKFTPRTKKSNWSYLNRKRAEKVINRGKMTKHGFAVINEAKKRGYWEPDETVKKELLKRIEQNRIAKDAFNQLSPSRQKQYLGWAATAKKNDTRIKRTDEIILKLENGILP